MSAEDSELFPECGLYEVKKCGVAWVLIPVKDENYPKYKGVIPAEAESTNQRIFRAKADLDGFLFKVFQETKHVFRIDHLKCVYDDSPWILKTKGTETAVLHVVNEENGDFLIALRLRD